MAIDQNELPQLLDKQAIKELKHKYLILCCKVSSPDQNGNLGTMERQAEVFHDPVRVTTYTGGIQHYLLTHDDWRNGDPSMLRRFGPQTMHGTSFEFHFDDADTCRTACLNPSVERSVRWPAIADLLTDGYYWDTWVRTPKGWRQSEHRFIYIFEQGGPDIASGHPPRIAEHDGMPDWEQHLALTPPWRGTPEEVAAMLAPLDKTYSIGQPAPLAGKVECTQHHAQYGVIRTDNFRPCPAAGDGKPCTFLYHD